VLGRTVLQVARKLDANGISEADDEITDADLEAVYAGGCGTPRMP
jgi:hypothetical protein